MSHGAYEWYVVRKLTVGIARGKKRGSGVGVSSAHEGNGRERAQRRDKGCFIKHSNKRSGVERRREEKEEWYVFYETYE